MAFQLRNRIHPRDCNGHSHKRLMDKVKWWIDDLKKAELTSVLPQFTIMSLGENHTRGS